MSLEAKRMIQHLSTRRSQIAMARTSDAQPQLQMLAANLGIDVAEDESCTDESCTGGRHDEAFESSMLVHGSHTPTGHRDPSADTTPSDAEGDGAPTHPSDRAPSQTSHRGQHSASTVPAIPPQVPPAASNGSGASITAEHAAPPHGYIFDDRYALLKQQLISIASDTNALDSAIGYSASQDQDGERGSSATAHIDPANAAASPESKACADTAAARHPPRPQHHPEEPMRLGARMADLGDQDRLYVKASYC